jgi:WD40 repeat protein
MGKEEMKLEGHSDLVASVTFSHNGKRVVSGAYDNTVQTWNMETGEREMILDGQLDWVRSVAFSHDGSRIVWIR